MPHHHHRTKGIYTKDANSINDITIQAFGNNIWGGDANFNLPLEQVGDNDRSLGSTATCRTMDTGLPIPRP